MAYDSNKDTFKFKYFIFHDKYEFRNAQTILTNFNKLCFESSKRLLWVFVNPVSGSGLSRDYYNKILLPVLEFTGINHEMFETSPKFFDTFFENLNIDEQKYTDFVVVGGDGLFGQLLNSVMAHKDKSKLMKLSFGFMPGGSCNALSCALGSKNPYLAAIQIARGITVKSDMFRIDMTDKGPTECSLNPFKRGTELAYLFIVFFANTHINSNLIINCRFLILIKLIFLINNFFKLTILLKFFILIRFRIWKLNENIWVKSRLF